MTYHLLHRGALCAALLLAAVPTLAQPTQDGPAGLGLRPTLGDEVPARQDPPPIGGPLACGAQAALFTGGGFRIWVTRQGSLEQENPLRPLSPETVLVFQVSVNGRVASAYGPDAQHLRQAGSPKALEESNPTPIRWAGGLDDLPPEFRVVSESGEVLLGPL
ncbi:MAG: hypothetical protein JWR08_2441, partial [Enterovirga sp.]|nr:hypothetical protein [Enterovirga sp.]